MALLRSKEEQKMIIVTTDLDRVYIQIEGPGDLVQGIAEASPSYSTCVELCRYESSIW